MALDFVAMAYYATNFEAEFTTCLLGRSYPVQAILAFRIELPLTRLVAEVA